MLQVVKINKLILQTIDKNGLENRHFDNFLKYFAKTCIFILSFRIANGKNINNKPLVYLL